MLSPTVKECPVVSSQRCALSVQICLTQKAVHLLPKFDDPGYSTSEVPFGIARKGVPGPPFLRQPPRDPAGLPIVKSLLSLPSISPHFKVFQTVSPLCRRQSPSCPNPTHQSSSHSLHLDTIPPTPQKHQPPSLFCQAPTPLFRQFLPIYWFLMPPPPKKSDFSVNPHDIKICHP